MGGVATLKEEEDESSLEQDSNPSENEVSDDRPWRVPMLLNNNSSTVPKVAAPAAGNVASNAGTQEVHHPCFFLNLWLQRLPVQDVVRDQAYKELSSLPSPLRSFAAGCATKIITKSMAVWRMGLEFPPELQASLEEAGIKTEVTEVYRKGTYLVLRVDVVHCNLPKMVSTKVSTKTARKVNWMAEHGGSIASRLGVKRRLKERSDQMVCPKIAAQLCDVLPQELPTKMAMKKPGLVVSVVAKPEAAQAQFFFDAVQGK